VDPHYQDNGNIYVSYVRSDNYQRLSRLTVTDPKAAVLTVDPDSELVLVQGTQPAGDDHQGGGLSFGPDGKLYWAVGDNTCCTVIDDKNAQSLSNMYGKVLRLNPDGTAPADNPFYDGAGPNYDAIYATGFRNPFRLTFTPDGQLLVVDVGQATWEEVNLVTRGANYGWPNAEGPCNGIGTTSCSTPSSYANPIYAYRHTTGGNSITSVMVYTGSTSGSGVNTVLIADFNQGWIKELTFNSDYASLIRERMFDDAAAGSTNQLAQDPEGNIYQLTFDGKLSRISPSSDVLSTV
jgi:glucose/arabinose dehydrogenase